MRYAQCLFLSRKSKIYLHTNLDVVLEMAHFAHTDDRAADGWLLQLPVQNHLPSMGRNESWQDNCLALNHAVALQPLHRAPIPQALQSIP
jgi:hypothetical protein